ncbi:allophanate hydrolase, partial [Candidatus Pelagibacter sp.]|nr:allophanate hydrolase [Candidatus Pelagibacter sp.]
LVDRMGIRLKGPKLENIENTNIKSEGLVRGVIQVPADGNPIIMLSDHGTVGGYPKIGVVIAADLDLVGQLTPGTKINFKEVSLEEAQNIFKAYTEDTNKYLNECN